MSSRRKFSLHTSKKKPPVRLFCSILILIKFFALFSFRKKCNISRAYDAFDVWLYILVRKKKRRLEYNHLCMPHSESYYHFDEIIFPEIIFSFHNVKFFFPALAGSLWWKPWKYLLEIEHCIGINMLSFVSGKMDSFFFPLCVSIGTFR